MWAGDFFVYPKGLPTKIPILITLVLFTRLGGSSLLEYVVEKTHDRDGVIESRLGDNNSLVTINYVRELKTSPLVCQVFRDCITKEKGRLRHDALIVHDPRTVASHNLVNLLILDGIQLMSRLISVKGVALFQIPLDILNFLPGLLYGHIG